MPATLMIEPPKPSKLREHREKAISIARGICAGKGPRSGCFCKGVAAHCHAINLYGDFASDGLAALEREFTVTRRGEPV